jgi:hypothetical protein
MAPIEHKWTRTMERHLGSAGGKRARYKLVCRYGFGVHISNERCEVLAAKLKERRMSIKGLSLVGFLDDRARAIEYLKARCVPRPGTADVDLEADWRTAKSKLGAPVARAGYPIMRPIALDDPHMQALLAVRWKSRFKFFLDRGATFQMTEIDPLIAGQISVDLEKSVSLCASLSLPPTQDELMRLSFPLALESGTTKASRRKNSVVVTSDSLNMVVGMEGPMPKMPHVIGIQLNWSLPLVHVVRLNGRSIVHNGYNRIVGARLAGATEIPCLFRDVADADSAGFPGGNTVDEKLLMSDNPPTVGHYTQGRAWEVQLRRTTRVIHVSWAQHTLYE